MSKVKRSKSFQHKNVKSSELVLPHAEQLNRNTMAMTSDRTEQNFSVINNNKKKQFIADLENNPQFQKQKSKLNRQKSVSCDSVNQETKKSAKLVRRKSKSVFDVRELIKSLGGVKEEELISKRKEPPFPVQEDEEIEIREKSLRRTLDNKSKTICEFRESKMKCPIIEEKVVINIKGVTKVVLDEENRTEKIRKGNMIQFTDQKMLIVDEIGNKTILAEDVEIVSENKISRKEMEFKDNNKRTYRLHFENTKDVKTSYFKTGSEVVRCNSLSQGEKTTIKNKLLRLLKKRSSRDILEKKGIIKNEPIFGNTLVNLQEKYKKNVPEFVTKTIELLERDKNITSQGVYRASGNLATIQKIRFEVDRNNLKILDDHENDVDVLAGALKLFFRELKEPLIPYQQYEEILEISRVSGELHKGNQRSVKNVIENLHVTHRETLICLINHLLKVSANKRSNLMDIFNLSVIWGPSVIWLPPEHNTTKQCQENIIAYSRNASRALESILDSYQSSSSPLQKIDSSNTQRSNMNFTAEENDKVSTISKKVDQLTKGISTFEGSLENLSINNQVYDFLEVILPLIEKKMKTPNLYITCGDKLIITKIKKKIDKRKYGELDKFKNNVHELTSVLKLFFTELEEPLIPNFIVERFAVDLSNFITNETKSKMDAEINNLPLLHKKAIFYLFEHFGKVLKESYYNQKTLQLFIKELALVLFGLPQEQLNVSIKCTEIFLELYSEKQIQNLARNDDFIKNEATLLDEYGTRKKKISSETIKNESSLHKQNNTKL